MLQRYTIPEDIVLDLPRSDPETLKNLPMYTDYYNIKADLPTVVDLRKYWGQCYNQLSLPSCSANACVGAVRCLTNKLGMEPFDGSRMFNYYTARSLWWDPNVASGTTISATFFAIQIFGLCQEKTWPYDISKYAIKPSKEAYDEANVKDITYLSIDPKDLNAIKQCLADGYPISFGLMLGGNWSAIEGYVPDPDNSPSKGAHAQTLVGYDDTTQMFIVANSWGEWGGMNGFLYLSYKYVQSGWEFITPRMFDRQVIPTPKSGRTDTVSLFSDVDYMGKQVEIDAGEYPNIAVTGIKMNDLGAVRVPDNYRVDIFTGLNFTGRTLSLLKNTRWLGWRNDSPFDDSAQSIKVVNLTPKPVVFNNNCTTLYSNVDNTVTPQNSIKSKNSNFTLQIKNTGEMVVVDSSSNVVFKTPVIDNNAYRLAAQDDGNLVIYNPSGAVWASNTQGKGKAPYNLSVSDMGVAAMNSSTGIIWSSPAPTPQPTPVPKPEPTPTPQPTPVPKPDPSPITVPVPALTNDCIAIGRNRGIQFGQEYSREASAGQIAYGKFDGGENGTLNIVGGGKVSGSRTVSVWDNLKVMNALVVKNRDILAELDEIKSKLTK